MPKQPDYKRRGKLTGQGARASFLSLPHFVLDSNEFAALPGNSVRLLLELMRQYRGQNNGALSATRKQLLERGWSSHDTMDVHLATLEESGWIVKTKQGGKRMGTTFYAVTIWPVDECNGKHDWPVERKASHLWKDKNKNKSTGPISVISRPDYQAQNSIAARKSGT